LDVTVTYSVTDQTAGTVRSESRCAIIEGVESDVHEPYPFNAGIKSLLATLPDEIFAEDFAS
jgi:hypothetical protein